MNHTLDHLLAFHCGPTLAGIKPANLLSLDQAAYPDLNYQIQKYNYFLVQCGLQFEIMCRCKDHWLLLVFRREMLEKSLQGNNVRIILQQTGYPLQEGVNGWITHLKKRLSSCGGFPHEIGLFLGYPIEDVLGFQEKQGKDYLLCGHWKVYANPEKAKRLFERYDRCRKAIYRRVEQGDSIIRVFCGAHSEYVLKEACRYA